MLLALVSGCTLLTAFQPSIDTAAMRAQGLTSHFVEGPVGRLHVVVAGRSDPGSPRVLFVHGSPGTWEAWHEFLDDPALRERAMLLAPDRPGYGGSRRGHTEASMVGQAAALAAVLEAFPGPPAVVVGHSLGGPIAARLAMDRPELVADLVLIAPSIDPALESHRWYNVAGSMRMVQWFLPVDWIVSNRELWPLRRELSAMLPLWGRLRAPVTLIQGDADELVSPANADFAERVLAGHDLVVERFPGENHFILWKRPAIVERAIQRMLERSGP